MPAAKLRYGADEILAEHAYARPHVEAGYRLHGGFDGGGIYVSPRTLHRTPAIQAWSHALVARGHELLDSSQQLMVRGSFPSPEQQKFLLGQGLGQTLWDSLTVTGVVEGRGRSLADACAPDFQSIIGEDISETPLGHLNNGLLRAHGLDEGGDASRGEGGHDAMWFAVRDLLFGKHAWPAPAIPESLSRPEIGRLMPAIPKQHEDWILLLMNILMIEVRAEKFFSFCTNVMRDPANFRDRREAALHAATLVDRIRQDEAPHVGYLTVAISELRRFTVRTVDGATALGRELIDPVWRDMVQWHAVANADHARETARAAILNALRQKPNGKDLEHRFDTLEHREAA
jgi:hypothetical protein